MRRLLLKGVVGLLLVAACGPTNVTILASTPSSVSVQSSDVPKGLTKCSQSGDVNKYLNELKASDPTSYDSTKAEWDQAKKDGATGAEFTFYASSQNDCSSLLKGSSGSAPSTAKVIGSVVIQFKDAASASKASTTESILGFDRASLRQAAAAGFTVTEGTKTGLGANSIVVSGSFGGTTLFVAAWSNKAFYLVVIGENEDATSMGHVATAANGRVH